MEPSRDSGPLEFTIGGGEIIPGFEEIVVGMKQGDTKTATIPSDDAYGPRRDDRIIAVERDRMPKELKPEVGKHVRMQSKSGDSISAMITEVTERHVTLDANHPLAGQDLTFSIELVEIL